MQVPRHPHTGLQTVSWLFTGEVEHRDSAGFHAMVRPGEINLMTAGRGISHSEFSTPGTDILHGAQLWVALPDTARHMEPTFESYRPEPVAGEGWALRVFLGTLSGSTSPVTTHSPLLGAEILLEPGASLELALDSAFEHGVLMDVGVLQLDGKPVEKDHLAFLPVGRTALTLTAGEEPVRMLLIGGEPLGEQILMWWNFVGRSHEEIVSYREQWQAEIGAEPASDNPAQGAPNTVRFGTFPPGQPAPLPAPALPTTRLRPRG
jgi:redox-sensitive bicupin YhaK (pirin superfamily)